MGLSSVSLDFYLFFGDFDWMNFLHVLNSDMKNYNSVSAIDCLFQIVVYFEIK